MHAQRPHTHPRFVSSARTGKRQTDTPGSCKPESDQPERPPIKTSSGSRKRFRERSSAAGLSAVPATTSSTESDQTGLSNPSPEKACRSRSLGGRVVRRAGSAGTDSTTTDKPSGSAADAPIALPASRMSRRHRAQGARARDGELQSSHTVQQGLAPRDEVSTGDSSTPAVRADIGSIVMFTDSDSEQSDTGDAEDDSGCIIC
jgi:hypothetical protein